MSWVKLGLKRIRRALEERISSNRPLNPEENLDQVIETIMSLLVELGKKKPEDVCITFSMLQSLRALDPKTFKDLTVTATCRENGKVFYFDATTTPDLDIAIACRASASLPVILSSVKIEKKYLTNYEDVPENGLSFVDGGYLDNIPVSAMQDKQGVENENNKGEQGQNLQTLVLVFDGGKRAENEQSPFLESQSEKAYLR